MYAKMLWQTGMVDNKFGNRTDTFYYNINYSQLQPLTKPISKFASRVAFFTILLLSLYLIIETKIFQCVWKSNEIIQLN